MFSEKDLKDYLAMKKEVRGNGFLLILISLICLICGYLDYELLGIPALSLVTIGIFTGLQAVSYFTSRFGSGKACKLIEKAIYSDSKSIEALSKLKST